MSMLFFQIWGWGCTQKLTLDQLEATPTPAPYLFRSGHEVDGSVVVVILLQKAEGELVVYQQVICNIEQKR